jgi:molybdopterin-guanine dinucleotide biosynthesis protein A
MAGKYNGKDVRMELEICILAGGLSRRMGRDKGRLRIGRRTLLGHIRAMAKKTGLPIRVIRRDIIARSGPLGGILTALKTTRCHSILFLACDMPFVSEELLNIILTTWALVPRGHEHALFASSNDKVGFPCILSQFAVAGIEDQLRTESFSMQFLAKALRARKLKVPSRFERELFNINTPADLALSRKWMAVSRKA